MKVYTERKVRIPFTLQFSKDANQKQIVASLETKFMGKNWRTFICICNLYPVGRNIPGTASTYPRKPGSALEQPGWNGSWTTWDASGTDMNDQRKSRKRPGKVYGRPETGWNGPKKARKWPEKVL